MRIRLKPRCGAKTPGAGRLRSLIVAGILILGLSSSGRGQGTGPLRVHPSNPRYFTDGSGRAIYLTGSQDGSELQDYAWGYVLDYGTFLTARVTQNHNWIRMWAVEHTRLLDTDTMSTTPMPFRRTGPGLAYDGLPRFDVTEWDPVYFNRLRTRVEAARDRGIYVSVMLFQGWSIETKGGSVNPWPSHPFHPSNNINGINGDANGDGEGLEVHSLQVPAITEVQQAYVRRVIDTVNDLDNVLYEISNEDRVSAEDTAWQYSMINFIKAYEAGKPKRHPVGMSAQVPSNDALFPSPADYVSPSASGGYGENPPAALGNKVVLLDTDHLFGCDPTASPEWVWKAFVRGHNPAFIECGAGEDALSIPGGPVHKALGHARSYAVRMNLASMVPRGDLTSTGFALADPGTEYLAFQPGGGGFSVNLSGVSGTYAVEWFTLSTGTASPANPVTGGASRNFSPPFGGPAVLYLKRSDGQPPATPQNLRIIR